MTVEAIKSLLSDNQETELITKGEIYDVIHEGTDYISVMADNGDVALFKPEDFKQNFKLYQDMADLVYEYDPGY